MQEWKSNEDDCISDCLLSLSMKIAKSAPIFGTRSHGNSDLQMKWQGKKNPHAGQGTGKKIKLSYFSNKQGTDGYKR